MKRLVLTVVLVMTLTGELAPGAAAQQSPAARQAPAAQQGSAAPPTGASSAAGQTPGVAVPTSDKFRLQIRFLAAWASDPANAALGFEQQGRIGYIIVGLSGKLSTRLSYLAEVNPVNETAPLAACGEQYYYYPNFLQGPGISVTCNPNGRMRVDDYRYVAFDPVRQQGIVRQAYLTYTGGAIGVKFGRFLLPIGFGWEETGAFTAKDSPHIARINAEANYGIAVSARAGTKADLSLSAVLGDGNRFHDYDYFYLIDGSLDSNSALAGILSASVRPVTQLEVRGAYKFGYTGSKVERLPNFFAAKRNDHAMVASVRYRPIAQVSVFGEYARYTWGLTRTSAAMLGVDGAPVVKDGYYVGAEASYPIGKFRLGGSVIREELSRDDALVKLMAEQGLYRVSMGKKERSTIYRLWLDAPGGVRIGWFYNDYSNPFPQLSGIVAVEGPSAYQSSRGSSKMGFAVQFHLR